MRRALLLAIALMLALAGAARADEAYERVARAYAEGGGQLDACRFAQPELEAGLAGIPPEVANVVPEIRQAIESGIAQHRQGACAGRQPADPDAPVSAAGAVPPVTTTPSTPPEPAPGAEPARSESAPAAGVREDDRTALLAGLVALGGLLLAALALWAWARMRGWDPVWTARARHAWGEAGFRTTTTWSEFSDWLRLGR